MQVSRKDKTEVFRKIYENTYPDILRFVIVKCRNVNDANDIVQEVYFELWKILKRKEIDESGIKSFLAGIAVNKIKKHYSLLKRINTVSAFVDGENETDITEQTEDPVDIEDLVINTNEWDRVWKYIKSKRNQNIPKVFYLFYVLDLPIKDISNELEVSESYVKNLIYRTLNELRSVFGKEI